MKNISILKNSYRGSDIYVVGSGASLDFIKGEFFENKVIVGVNSAYKKIRCSFSICKENLALKQLLAAPEDQRGIVVASEYDCGNKELVNDEPQEYYTFKHLENKGSLIDLRALDLEGHLVVSFTTYTSAIHLACFLGAKNIILVGHDLGLIDGRMNFKGYYEDGIMKGLVKDRYFYLLNRFESQTIRLVSELRQRGINILSINPFINFGLEGHVYSRGGFLRPIRLFFGAIQYYLSCAAKTSADQILPKSLKWIQQRCGKKS